MSSAPSKHEIDRCGGGAGRRMCKPARTGSRPAAAPRSRGTSTGYRLPGGPVYSKGGMMTCPAANAIYRRETFDNYPAARAILQVVYEGLQLPMDLALRVESRWFAKIVRSPEAAAMMRSLFVSMQDLNKGARRPAAVPPSKIKRVGIVGAGFMGASIGYVTAQAGIEVVLIDRDQPSADKGKAHAEKLIGEQVTRGRATAADRDALLARITATTDYGCAQGLRPRHRGGVRRSQGQGRDDQEGSGHHRRQRDFWFQHIDPADHLAGAGFQGSGALYRHSFLLAGGKNDAGRSHSRQEDRRRGAGDRARLCPRNPQDADRRQRLARLLHLARGRHLSAGRSSDAGGRRAAGDDRECRTHGRHAGRTAVAQR